MLPVSLWILPHLSAQLARPAGEAVLWGSLNLDLLLTEVGLMSLQVQRRHPPTHTPASKCARLYSGGMWNQRRAYRLTDGGIVPMTHFLEECCTGRKEGRGAHVFGRPCAEHMVFLTVEILRNSPNKRVDWGAGRAQLGCAPYITKSDPLAGTPLMPLLLSEVSLNLHPSPFLCCPVL